MESKNVNYTHVFFVVNILEVQSLKKVLGRLTVVIELVISGLQQPNDEIQIMLAKCRSASSSLEELVERMPIKVSSWISKCQMANKYISQATGEK